MIVCYAECIRFKISHLQWIIQELLNKPHNSTELTAKYRFIKGEGFYGITVEVDVWVD